jgi:hypothetical protein
MTTNEKPHVDVPSDQPPSYQLELEDFTVGGGDEAVPGRVVEVHYVGVSWATGKQFDASASRSRHSSPTESAAPAASSVRTRRWSSSWT